MTMTEQIDETVDTLDTSDLSISSDISILRISILDRFPTEMILHIVELLDDISAILFSLTSRRYYSILRGEKRIWRPTKHKGRRHRLLEFLEPYLVRHILCFNCARLHCADQAGSFVGYADRKTESLQCPRQGAQIRHWFDTRVLKKDYNIYLSLVQIIVKLHWKNADFSKEINLLKRQTICESAFPVFGGRQTRLLQKSEARIVDGQLLLRVRASYRVPHSWLKTERYWKVVTTNAKTSRMGTHLNVFLRSCQKEAKAQHPDAYWKNINTDISFGEVMYCIHCEIEFQIDHEVYPRGLALFITRWIGLGEGGSSLGVEWRTRSVRNRESRLCQRHTPSRDEFWWNDNYRGYVRYKGQDAMSVARAFETGSFSGWNTKSQGFQGAEFFYKPELNAEDAHYLFEME